MAAGHASITLELLGPDGAALTSARIGSADTVECRGTVRQDGGQTFKTAATGLPADSGMPVELTVTSPRPRSFRRYKRRSSDPRLTVGEPKVRIHLPSSGESTANLTFGGATWHGRRTEAASLTGTIWPVTSHVPVLRFSGASQYSAWGRRLFIREHRGVTTAKLGVAGPVQPH